MFKLKNKNSGFSCLPLLLICAFVCGVGVLEMKAFHHFNPNFSFEADYWLGGASAFGGIYTAMIVPGCLLALREAIVDKIKLKISPAICSELSIQLSKLLAANFVVKKDSLQYWKHQYFHENEREEAGYVNGKMKAGIALTVADYKKLTDISWGKRYWEVESSEHEQSRTAIKKLLEQVKLPVASSSILTTLITVPAAIVGFLLPPAATVLIQTKLSDGKKLPPKPPVTHTENVVPITNKQIHQVEWTKKTRPNGPKTNFEVEPDKKEFSRSA